MSAWSRKLGYKCLSDKRFHILFLFCYHEDMTAIVIWWLRAEWRERQRKTTQVCRPYKAGSENGHAFCWRSYPASFGQQGSGTVKQVKAESCGGFRTPFRPVISDKCTSWPPPWTLWQLGSQGSLLRFGRVKAGKRNGGGLEVRFVILITEYDYPEWSPMQVKSFWRVTLHSLPFLG